MRQVVQRCSRARAAYAFGTHNVSASGTTSNDAGNSPANSPSNCTGTRAPERQEPVLTQKRIDLIPHTPGGSEN